VQLWFGEFVHGVLESAFRIWNSTSPRLAFPWPCNPTPYRQQAPPARANHDIGTLGDIVETNLRARGKNPRSGATRDSAYLRVEKAVNEVGPHLFPLIATAEQSVIGTREIPSALGVAPARARMYELHGIIDVLTDIQLNAHSTANVITDAIQAAIPAINGRFEVIVDYKGSRRPAVNHAYWSQAEWQIQTYAWLRMRQPNASPVVAGVLIYVNELAPGYDDIKAFKNELRQNATDVIPVNGSRDAYEISSWRPQDAVPSLSASFRIARALRVVPIDAQSQILATRQFDQTVLNIEQRAAAEAATGIISNNWDAGGDEETCVACDFRHFCPNPAPRSNTARQILAPPAP
jgi:hypothetical protein